MANPYVTRERIEDEVRAALATTLRIEDPSTIGMDASIINDLGATSIDFLDINFRLEQVFGIQLASQLLLDHVEEVCGEGTAIDRDNKITTGAAELLKAQFGQDAAIEAGMYADEVPAFVTAGSVATAVEKILDTLPEGCGEDGTKEWVCEDGALVTCSDGGAPAEYKDGDTLTQAWIHDVKSQYFPDA